jgi:hypothetical protein
VRRNVQLEWPDGKDLKPSMSWPPLLRSGFVQISEVTRTQFTPLTPLTAGFTRVEAMRLRSGWQRDSRSGRGFPNMSFMPCVIRKAVASESARPIQPMFSSHSFLRQMSALGVPLLAVGPGTKTKHTTKMMAAGATSVTRMRSHVGMVSWCWNGYEMLRSTGEKGRL